MVYPFLYEPSNNLELEFYLIRSCILQHLIIFMAAMIMGCQIKYDIVSSLALTTECNTGYHICIAHNRQSGGQLQHIRCLLHRPT